MSEDNPYILVREIIELYNELYGEDLSWEYNDLTMSMCRDYIIVIEQKHQKLVEWIKKKEEENKKSEGKEDE